MSALPDDILDLLTAYALDALEPEEIARVGELLEKDPDLRHTLAELRMTIHSLPYALPEAVPSPDLRRRVLDRAVGRAHTPISAPAPAPQPLAGRVRGWLLGLGGLAAAGLVAAAIAWAQLFSLQNDLAQARAALEQEQLARREVAQVVLQSEPLVTLEGEGGEGALFRAPNGQAVLAANLPALEQGRVYQLWMIAEDNAPVSGGTFVVDREGYGLITFAPGVDVPSARTFAITEEPGPSGSSGPTSPVLIVGSLPSA